MAIRNTFMPSVSQDRVYNSLIFVNYLANHIPDGIIEGHLNSLLIAPSGSNIIVESGSAFYKGHWYENTDSQNIGIPLNVDPTTKLHGVILRVNRNTFVRNVSIALLESSNGIDFTNDLLDETLEDESGVSDLLLAKFFVAPGTQTATNFEIVAPQSYTIGQLAEEKADITYVDSQDSVLQASIDTINNTLVEIVQGIRYYDYVATEGQTTLTLVDGNITKDTNIDLGLDGAWAIQDKQFTFNYVTKVVTFGDALEAGTEIHVRLSTPASEIDISGLSIGTSVVQKEVATLTAGQTTYGIQLPELVNESTVDVYYNGSYMTVDVDYEYLFADREITFLKPVLEGDILELRILVPITEYTDIATENYVDVTVADTQVSEVTTYTVGATGDYATLNEAIEDVSKKYPTYVANTADQPRVLLELQSGFVMEEQVIVKHLNLSWITIISVDAEVVIDRAYLTTLVVDRYPAFAVRDGGHLPIIATLFSMNTNGTASNRDGIYVYNNSKAYIANGRGVKNAGGVGLYAFRNSTVSASGCVFSGATGDGVNATENSIISCENAVVTDCATGMSASECSSIFANGANASGFATYGIESRYGSNVVADGSAIAGTGTIGAFCADNSRLYVTNSTINGATSYLVYATENGYIDCANSAVSDASAFYAIYSRRGSQINARNVNALGSSYEYVIGDGGIIHAHSPLGGNRANVSKNALTGAGIVFQ